jgi:hypothetical protein
MGTKSCQSVADKGYALTICWTAWTAFCRNVAWLEEIAGGARRDLINASRDAKPCALWA